MWRFRGIALERGFGARRLNNQESVFVMIVSFHDVAAFIVQKPWESRVRETL